MKNAPSDTEEERFARAMLAGMPELYESNDYSPNGIAERVENVGVAKAKLPKLSMAALGVLASGFVGFGALFYTVVARDPSLGFAAKRVLGGVVFSLGLILVVIAGGAGMVGLVYWVIYRRPVQDAQD